MKPLARMKHLTKIILFGQQQRRHIPPDLSLEQFFSRLNDADCRYIVLRWFEGFPRTTEGDIDLLVHDDDVDAVKSFLCPVTLIGGMMGRYPRSRKCDVYSVSGLPETSYKGFPYYPPHLASILLERAELHPSGVRIPCKEDYFVSLAYHALYHKGLTSGLPTSNKSLHPDPGPKHDYAGRLQQLADKLNIKVAIDMEALDAWLNARGWRPPVDMIAKRSTRDAWCGALVEDILSREVSKEGLTAFIVRERALKRPGSIQRIRALLEDEGFNILAVKTLSAEESGRLARHVRGGNWGRGTWPISGGRPAVVLAAVDVFPSEPNQEVAGSHPGADNARIFAAKECVRNWWNEQQPDAERCNILHSTDNCRHASLCIQLAMPELHEFALQEADRLVGQSSTGGDVVRRFSNYGRRAIVELVRQSNQTLVVRKTFRPGREVYLERELQTLKDLHKICPDVVPTVLESGVNYFIMPFYRDARRKIFGRYEMPLPIYAVRKAFRAARSFFDSGYIHMDFRPRNLIVQGGGEIKIIDFEFVVDCRSTTLLKGYDFSDVALGRIKDWPLTPAAKRPVSLAVDYKRSWGYAAALPLHSILHDPLWLLYVKRWPVGYFTVTGKLALIKMGRKLMTTDIGSRLVATEIGSKWLRIVRRVVH